MTANGAVSKREVVVVGGGPGGLQAALSAAHAGAQVTLLDAYPTPGGQYYHQLPERLLRRSTPRQREGRALWQQVQAAGVEICSETVVWNVDADKHLWLYTAKGAQEMQASSLILATGAYERAVAFPGWTLPGVITAGAAQILLYHRMKPGLLVLMVGAGPLQLVTAANLLKAGIRVVGVLEGAQLIRHAGGLGVMWGQWGRIREGMDSMLRLAKHKVPYRTGWGIVAAHGRETVEVATIARLDTHWRPIPGSEQEVRCDTICIGFGLIPFNGLARLAGAVQVWRPELGGEVPVRDARMQTSVPGIYAVGDGAGIGGYRMAMLEGQVAGIAAAASLGFGQDNLDAALRHLRPALQHERRFQQFYSQVFTPGPGIFELAQADTLVCRCEGVTFEQLRLAVEAGVTRGIEAKASTRCGMGECQGRVCGHQVMHTIAQLTGRPVQSVGSYNIRPPLFPIPIGALAEQEN